MCLIQLFLFIMCNFCLLEFIIIIFGSHKFHYSVQSTLALVQREMSAAAHALSASLHSINMLVSVSLTIPMQISLSQRTAQRHQHMC